MCWLFWEISFSLLYLTAGKGRQRLCVCGKADRGGGERRSKFQGGNVFPLHYTAYRVVHLASLTLQWSLISLMPLGVRKMISQSCSVLNHFFI